MATLNKYSIYSNLSTFKSDSVDNFEADEMIRTYKAFAKFSFLETKEEMEDYLNEICQGQKGNRIFELDGEKIIVEYSEDSVKVTLYSNEPGRNNKYFEIHGLS